MIEWFLIAQVVVAVASGLVCLATGALGREPNDLSNGATALVGVLLLAQVVVSIVAPFTGNTPTGDPIEFWVYLVSALLLPPLAIGWGLIDRSRWATIVLGVVCLAVAVMVYRMGQIWFVQIA